MEEADQSGPSGSSSAPASRPAGSHQRTLSASTTATTAEDRQVQPADAGDEEHGEERGGVHERRADVGLDEHEQDRRQRERDRRQRRPRSSPSAGTGRRGSRRARGRSAASRTRTAGTGRSRGRSSASSRGRPCRRRKTNDEEEQRPDVELLLVAAVDVGVDQDRDHEAEHADRDEDDLAVDVVVGVAGDVVLRDPGDRPEAVGDDADDRARASPSRGARAAARPA